MWSRVKLPSNDVFAAVNRQMAAQEAEAVGHSLDLLSSLAYTSQAPGVAVVVFVDVIEAVSVTVPEAGHGTAPAAVEFRTSLFEPAAAGPLSADLAAAVQAGSCCHYSFAKGSTSSMNLGPSLK